MRYVLTIALAALLFCVPAISREASAQECGSAALATSIVFGFDEDADNDLQPDFWRRTLDRNHPHYVSGGLDFSTAHAGQGSVRISAGGAAAEFLGPPVALAGTSAYDVSAWVRTDSLPATGLRATSAYVEARLFDKGGALLCSSRAFPQVSGTSDWQRVHLADVSGHCEEAATLRLALVLDGLALEGAAWFDTVEVQRRPLATLSANRPANAFLLSDRKTFTFEGRGLSPGSYAVTITVADARGTVAHEASLQTEAGAAGTASAVYVLPALPAGSYSVEVEFAAGAAVIFRQIVRMAILPDYGDVEPAKNFGIVFSPEAPTTPGALELAELLGVGWAKIHLDARDAAGKVARHQFVNALRREGVTPVGILAAGAAAGFETTPGEGLLAMMLQGRDGWAPVLGDAINTFAGSIQWWQLGDDRDEALGTLAESRGVFGDFSHFVNEVSFQARIGLPAGSSRLPQQGAVGPDFLTVDAARAASVAAHAWPDRARGASLWAWTDMSEWCTGDADAGISRAAAEISSLFACGVDAVFLRDPWRRMAALDSDGNITPFAVGLINLFHELANHRYSGTFSFPGQTPNALYAQGGNVKVLLWPSDSPHEERIFLGEAVEGVDIYGRRIAIPVEDGEHLILVDRYPLIIRGVDPGIVDTRKTFEIEPAVIDSRYEVQPVYVSFTNMFAGAIVGELILSFPPGWDAQPKLFSIRLKPGESFRARSNLIVPYNALTGMQEISATLNLGGAQNTRIVRPRELGSHAFRVDIETRTAGTELLVYQKVTNISGGAVDVIAFLEGPGLERVERLPRRIEKDATTTFSYALGGAGQWSGRSLRASIRERQTNRFLNLEFTVPEAPAQ